MEVGIGLNAANFILLLGLDGKNHPKFDSRFSPESSHGGKLEDDLNSCLGPEGNFSGKNLTLPKTPYLLPQNHFTKPSLQPPEVLSNLDTAEKRSKFGGFVTMAHTKPDSFMEFEGAPHREIHQLSNEKKVPGCLGSIGDYTPNYVGILMEFEGAALLSIHQGFSGGQMDSAFSDLIATKGFPQQR